MDKFFKKVCQLFDDNTVKFTDAGLAAVKTIDKFRGQPLNPAAFELFELPALFVGMSIIWTKKGKFYEGALTVNFHVLQDATWEVSNISTNQDEGLKQIQFIAMVRSLLDDLESDNTGKLVRLDELEADVHVSIYNILNYTCPYYEPEAAGKTYIDAAGDKLNINKKLKEQLP